jgi:hypothetical protein
MPLERRVTWQAAQPSLPRKERGIFERRPHPSSSLSAFGYGIPSSRDERRFAVLREGPSPVKLIVPKT